MNNLKRKAFLKQIGLLGAAFTVFPKPLLASPKANTPGTALTPINTDAIIDLHCHPSMKMNLFGEKIWRYHHPVPGPNNFHMQENTKELSAGNVKGMIATHYLIEAAVESQWDILKKLFPVIRRLFVSLAAKVEHENDTNIDQLIAIMKMMETQIGTANQKQGNVKFVIATTFAQFKAAMDAGSVPLAHSIEGSHALGRNIPVSAKRKAEFLANRHLNALGEPQGYMVSGSDNNDPKKYIDNLEKLAGMGVCLITLSHFFKNDISYPVDGISPDEKKGIEMAWQFTPDKNHPLTIVGRAVVQRMLEIGVIVDLTHSTPAVRKDVFDINRENNRKRTAAGQLPRPLVFTHVGAQTIYDYYDQGHYPYFKYYNVSDEEIDWISECNGVIGVIPENFWLTGADTHMKREFDPYRFRYGIPYIIETMKYINSKTRTGDFSNIGIGTDFDGLADNPRDLYKASMLEDLFAALHADPDISAAQVKLITHQNAERLLKLGWGN